MTKTVRPEGLPRLCAGEDGHDSDDTWHVIRNIRGVTGFVGTSSNDPTPLTDEEVYAMGVEKQGDRRQLSGWRYRQDSGRPADLLHRHRGKHRRGQQLRQCGGFHVWPRDLRRVRARPWWRSYPSNRHRIFIRLPGGRGEIPRKNAHCASLPHLIQEVLIMAQKVTGIIKLQIHGR